MDNATTVWVASRSSYPSRALDAGNIIGIYAEGERAPHEGAEAAARGETLASGGRTYLYEVDIIQLKGYQVHKEVRAFAPPR